MCFVFVDERINVLLLPKESMCCPPDLHIRGKSHANGLLAHCRTSTLVFLACKLVECARTEFAKFRKYVFLFSQKYTSNNFKNVGQEKCQPSS